LGFLDSNATPTNAYRDYRDSSIAKRVLARQVRLAYNGLFVTDESAHKLSGPQVKGRLATLTGKDERVVEKMASTFTSLCKLADFTDDLSKVGKADTATEQEQQVVESPAFNEVRSRAQTLAFSHVVYINLPTTRDVAVYDAIFKSIREHLL
jgi:hypothetical protein